MVKKRLSEELPMLKKTYWKLYKAINSYIFKLVNYVKRKVFHQFEGFTPRHIGDVFFNKITKRSWRIADIIQDIWGDYHYIIRDDKGRIRAIKDYSLDSYIDVYKTIKPIRIVAKDELKLDKELEVKVHKYISYKRELINQLNKK